MENKTKPIHTIRRGSIEGAIWENQTESGATTYGVTIDRTYEKDGTLKSTGRFSKGHLLQVARVAELAESWVYEKEKSQKDVEGQS